MNKKFKRTLAGLTAFLMAFSAAAIPQVADGIGLSISASATISGAYGVEVEGLEYVQFDINDNIATVRGLSYGHENDVTEIVIPEKINYYEEEIPVTSIRSAAFQNCKSLTKVTIPSSVTTIGDRAFVGCSSLASVEIAAGVETIGESAFQSCTSLTSIVIPESVKTIGKGAFSYCSELTSVSLPSTVTSIGDEAFPNLVKLETISVADSNPNYSAVDNVLFNKDQTELIVYPAGKTGDSYSVPDTVTTIGKSAFYGSKLKSIYIPKTVTSIGQKAFFNCSFLTNIEIDEENTNFSFSSNLFIDEKNKVLLAYMGDKTITSLEIPNGIVTIGENALYSCRNLTSVTIPESVQTIGDFAFAKCESLPSVTIPNNVTSIGEYAFNYCTSLESIEIPGSVASIGKSAFSNCKKLSAVTLNEGITSIGQQAFGQCDSLTTITIPKTVTEFGWGVFSNSGLTSAVFADGIKTTGTYTFDSCKKLTSVEIPESVTKIDVGVFAQCTGLTEYTIPDSITEIGNQVFYDCSDLKNVVIPSSVKKIGGSAFMRCTGLTEISIPKGVETIDSMAFNGCTGLKNITIPGSVTSIDVNAFYGCSGLETLTIPESLKDTKWLGLPEGIQIIISSNAVTFNSEYVTVTKGDSTSVESGAELEDGVELTITVNVSAGMILNSVKANGETLTAEEDGTYKFTTSGGAAIVADVVAKEYTLAVTSNENATIVVKDEEGNALENGATLNYSDKFTVEVTPAAGYKTTAVSVENATLVDTLYTVDDVADGTTITVSATVEEKVFTLKTIPENVTLTKNENDVVTAEANNTFKKGDKITISPVSGYDMVMLPSVGNEWATGDGQGNAYYIFTGEETEGEFTIFTGVQKCFKIDTTNVPAHTKLYLRMEVGGEKSARAATEIVDYAVTENTTFYKNYTLVIKIDEGCKVVGDVKVGETTVNESETVKGEYVYTFTGNEDNSNPIAVSATVKEASQITSISDGITVKNGENAVKGDDEVLEGDVLTITVDELGVNKLNRVIANGTVLSANEDGTYTFTVGTSDVTIDSEIAKPKSIEVVGLKDKYFSGVEKATAISGLELNVTYDDNSVAYHVPVTEAMLGETFSTANNKMSFTITYGTATKEVSVDLTEVAVEKIAVTTDLTKREYKVGEELSLDGGVITVYNNDGTSSAVNMSDASVSVTGYDTETEPNSDLKLTITYTNNGVDYTTEYSIVVVAADAKEVSSIAISTHPTKTAYFVGDELTVDGKITVTYSDDSSEDIDITPAMVMGFNSSAAAAKQTLTVTYGGKTATYNISVTAVDITGITVTAPTKTNYMVGDSLDLTGGEIKVTYNNGKEETLSLVTAGVSVSALDSSTVGEKTINVTYNGQSGSFKINVAEKSYKVNFTDATVKNGDVALTTGTSVAENTVLTVTAAAKDGYTATLKINGTAVSGTSTTITVINDVTISVSYTKNSSGGSGGSGGSSGGSGGSSGGSSGSSGGSSTSVAPTVDGKEQTWNDVASDIAKLTEGKTQTIDLNGGKTVPVEVVEAIAKSNSKVTFKVDDVFSWTVDGSNMEAKDAQKANLAIVKRTVSGTSELRGSVGTGFAINNTNVKSELNINFKTTHSGEFANLYKKVDGKLVFVDNVKIDKNGAAIGLEVSESGEYVVMLGEFSDRAGDMDNDGILNAKDSLSVLKDFLGLESGVNPLVADINNDGFINAKDALIILKTSLGIK